jgi:hypothetical protein
MLGNSLVHKTIPEMDDAAGDCGQSSQQRHASDYLSFPKAQKTHLDRVTATLRRRNSPLLDCARTRMNRNLPVWLNEHVPAFFRNAPARFQFFPLAETSTTALEILFPPFSSPEYRTTLPAIGFESSTIHQSPHENPPFGS